MIPDYQTLMRPVLACAAAGETKIGDAVEQLADQLGLTPDERAQLLPSGKQTMFANRVHWAKTYLVKAGLAEGTRRGYYRITPRGQAALEDAPATINNAYLDQFKEFQDFKAKVNEVDGASSGSAASPLQVPTHVFKLVFDSHSRQAWAHWQRNMDDEVASKPISYSELVQRTGGHNHVFAHQRKEQLESGSTERALVRRIMAVGLRFWQPKVERALSGSFIERR
ncbi:winged helix-turn-helix domain-containing protein [Roseateles sp.]|uniref:winged helix-turn-helix domain-containing protein n=1 Tax=Roseateles sp. TaxID=1971397 RepID=UPI003D0E6AAA